ncbi:MAG TPA: 50S ribosomal protein L18 [Clostridia bacterium]|nr:50S ribosomal protein L18 [Clostridia bacterium]
MKAKILRNVARKKRHMRIRSKISGTHQRPRLCVYRSLNHVYAQIIDDEKGNTLACASTLDREIRDKIKHGGNCEAARLVGQLLARKAREAGIQQVVFDRGGYIYHGVVKSLAEGAREGGLDF